MTATLIKILNFFSLLDEAGNLSITNLAVIVCVTKIATAPEFSMAEMGALIATLLNYIHKRHVIAGAPDADS